MKIQKTFIGAKMNKDLDERLLPQGQYPHAENIRVANTDASDVGAVENVRGNYQLTNFSLTNAVTIGGYADSSNQKLYWFITSDEKDMVVEYDFRNSISHILLQSTAKTGVLKFDREYLITGVVKIINDDSAKDLLAWTDDVNPPRLINIERVKSYSLDGFTEDDISVIKKPPRYAPKTQLTYTNTSLENNLDNKFLSFAYRYKYVDGELSALSSFTNYSFAPEKFDLDYETMENEGMVNAFNAVNITVDTGGKNVTDVEIVFKESNSNTVFLVETFNKKKEMWGNNEQRTFKFSNSKKYVALPEDELYRPYDNVPLLAKALTLCGNRLMFGNYTEGYDLVNIHGEDINIDYDISLKTRNLDGADLPSNLIGTTTFNVDLTGVVLKESSRLTFVVGLAEPLTTQGEFSNSFDFILNRNYTSVNDLATDSDFKVFVEDIMTSYFSQNYTSNIPSNYSVLEIIKFGVSSIGNLLRITAPKIKYIIDNDVNNTTTTNWNFLPTSSASYSEVSIKTSLKSNRSYEAGIIYLDKYNRATTVLTDVNNTLYVPQVNALTQNKMVVNINNQPPYWADRYKIVIKQNKGNYYNIYTNFVYRDGLYAWFKLEGSNKNKVKEGDYVILKADSNRVYNNILKYQVLEIKNQPKNFLEDNVDTSGEEIEEQAGLYMKLKTSGFNINSDNNKVYKASGNRRSENKNTPPSCYVDLFSTLNNNVVEDLAIKRGSRITLKFDSSFNYDSGWSSHKMTKSFLVLKDYNNFKEWYDDVIATTTLKCEHGHDYKNGLAVIKGDAVMIGNTVVSVSPNANGKLWLKVQGHETGGSRGRAGFVDAEVSIVTSDQLYIFETEAEDLDNDIYYETEQTFDIVNNNHNGNVQNQNLSQPAILELNFFNCFTQGNGVESYQYKDSFNANKLSVDLRPVSTSVEKYKSVRRFADLTYSEPYNANNNVNGLNEFNLYRANYKEDINKNWGSIQKLRNRNNDLLVFQEDKVSYVMYGKELLMNADGSSNVSAIENILGTQVPYSGEYGISKVPESHAFDGFYDYWQDSKRGCVCRLSGDGINEISQYGMKQYFKENFRNTVNNKKLGGYDPYYDEYIVYSSNTEKISPVNMSCSESVNKTSFNGQFMITVDYGAIIGQCGFSYTTNGKPVHFTIEINGVVTDLGFAGDSSYNDELDDLGFPVIIRPANGTIMFDKPDRNPNIIIRVNAPLCDTTLNLEGVCPVKTEGKVFFVVTNQSSYEGKHFLTRYKYVDGTYSSSFKINEGLFNQGVVSVFEEITGNKGTGYIPQDGSNVIMEVFYNSQEEPIFKNGGRFGYLKTNDILTQSDIEDILDDMTVLSKTENIAENNDVTYRANFNCGSYEYLYLIYDHVSPPVAVDDVINVNRGGTIDYDLRVNDIEPNGLPLSVTLETVPVYGTVTINSNGSIKYTHDGQYQINDSFKYSVSNGSAKSNIANVNVIVSPNAPVAVNDSFDINKGDSITRDLRVNDSDPLNLPLTVVLDDNPSYGNVNINANGTITYNHDGLSVTPDSFTYHVNNGYINSNIATVNINVGVTSSCLKYVFAYAGYEPDHVGTINYVDCDGVTQVATMTYDESGGNYYTIDICAIQIISLEGTVMDVTNYVNQPSCAAPPIAVNDYFNVAKGQTKNFDVRLNDTDPLNLPMTVVLDDLPSSGTVTIESDGTVTYVHDDTDTVFDSFSYHVNNGYVDSNTATVNIDIAIGCDESFTMSGGTGDFDLPISYGTTIGDCGVSYDMYSIPDKCEIIWDGQVVATTGALVSGQGTLIFNKNKAFPTVATVRMTAPNSGTAWVITGICPNANITERVEDMIEYIENENLEE